MFSLSLRVPRPLQTQTDLFPTDFFLGSANCQMFSKFPTMDRRGSFYCLYPKTVTPSSVYFAIASLSTTYNAMPKQEKTANQTAMKTPKTCRRFNVYIIQVKARPFDLHTCLSGPFVSDTSADLAGPHAVADVQPELPYVFGTESLHVHERLQQSGPHLAAFVGFHALVRLLHANHAGGLVWGRNYFGELLLPHVFSSRTLWWACSTSRTCGRGIRMLWPQGLAVSTECFVEQY